MAGGVGRHPETSLSWTTSRSVRWLARPSACWPCPERSRAHRCQRLLDVRGDDEFYDV